MTPSPEPGRQKILIVEDDAHLSAMLRARLEHEGYEAIEASKGDAAISRAQAHHPDLILMDVILPGGLDGVQTYHRLKGKRSTQGIPVIFLTGTEPKGSVATRNLPLAEELVVIGKPFRSDRLMLEIRRLLKEGTKSKTASDQASGPEDTD